MEIIDYKLDTKKYSSKLFDEYFKDCSVGFFDLETTGLSPQNCQIVLAGLTMPNGHEQIARQYFADELEEEDQVLVQLINDLQELDVIVTYNGAHFDIPFLQKRMLSLGLPYPQKMPYHLDLYQLVKNHSDIRKFLPNLKQKTIEKFLGLCQDRDDEIDGGESVRLYYKWLRYNDKKTKETILLHNKDDIMQLSRLMEILPKTNFHSAMKSFGFPCSFQETKSRFQISKVMATKKEINIEGIQIDNPINYVFFGDQDLSFIFNEDGKEFSIKAKLHESNGIIFADPEDFSIENFENRWNDENDPAIVHGLIVLKNGAEINYRAMNRFARLLLLQIIEKYII